VGEGTFFIYVSKLSMYFLFLLSACPNPEPPSGGEAYTDSYVRVGIELLNACITFFENPPFRRIELR